MPTQDILADEKRWSKVLALVPLDNLRKKLESEAMRAGRDSVDRWKRMEAIVKQEGPVGKRYIDEIMLQGCNSVDTLNFGASLGSELGLILGQFQY